jgi:hypothetical protein
MPLRIITELYHFLYNRKSLVKFIAEYIHSGG